MKTEQTNWVLRSNLKDVRFVQSRYVVRKSSRVYVGERGACSGVFADKDDVVTGTKEFWMS